MGISPVKIRTFNKEDQKSARDLIISGLGEYFDQIDHSLNDDLNDIVTSYIKTNNDFIIAEIDCQLVGTGALIKVSDDTGRIVRVSVLKTMRNRGIGKTIVEHLVDMGQTRKFKQIVVETNIDWIAAKNLYRGLGFKESARNEISIHFTRNL